MNGQPKTTTRFPPDDAKSEVCDESESETRQKTRTKNTVSSYKRPFQSNLPIVHEEIARGEKDWTTNSNERLERCAEVALIQKDAEIMALRSQVHVLQCELKECKLALKEAADALRAQHWLQNKHFLAECKQPAADYKCDLWVKEIQKQRLLMEGCNSTNKTDLLNRNKIDDNSKNQEKVINLDTISSKLEVSEEVESLKKQLQDASVLLKEAIEQNEYIKLTSKSDIELKTHLVTLQKENKDLTADYHRVAKENAELQRMVRISQQELNKYQVVEKKEAKADLDMLSTNAFLSNECAYQLRGILAENSNIVEMTHTQLARAQLCLTRLKLREKELEENNEKLKTNKEQVEVNPLLEAEAKESRNGLEKKMRLSEILQEVLHKEKEDRTGRVFEQGDQIQWGEDIENIIDRWKEEAPPQSDSETEVFFLIQDQITAFVLAFEGSKDDDVNDILVSAKGIIAFVLEHMVDYLARMKELKMNYRTLRSEADLMKNQMQHFDVKNSELEALKEEHMVKEQLIDMLTAHGGELEKEIEYLKCLNEKNSAEADLRRAAEERLYEAQKDLEAERKAKEFFENLAKNMEMQCKELTDASGVAGELAKLQNEERSALGLEKRLLLGNLREFEGKISVLKEIVQELRRENAELHENQKKEKKALHDLLNMNFIDLASFNESESQCGIDSDNLRNEVRNIFSGLDQLKHEIDNVAVSSQVIARKARETESNQRKNHTEMMRMQDTIETLRSEVQDLKRHISRLNVDIAVYKYEIKIFASESERLREISQNIGVPDVEEKLRPYDSDLDLSRGGFSEETGGLKSALVCLKKELLKNNRMVCFLKEKINQTRVRMMEKKSIAVSVNEFELGTYPPCTDSSCSLRQSFAGEEVVSHSTAICDAFINMITFEEHSENLRKLELRCVIVILLLHRISVSKIKKTINQHEKNISNLQKAYNENMNQIRKRQDGDLRKLTDRHKESMLRLQSIHEKEIHRLKFNHKYEMDMMQSQNESIIAEMKFKASDEMNRLIRNQNHEMKEREAQYWQRLNEKETEHMFKVSNLQLNLSQNFEDVNDLHDKTMKNVYRNMQDNLTGFREKHNEELSKLKGFYSKQLSSIRERYEKLMKDASRRCEDILLEDRKHQQVFFPTRSDLVLDLENNEGEDRQLRRKRGAEDILNEVLRKIATDGVDTLTPEDKNLVHRRVCQKKQYLLVNTKPERRVSFHFDKLDLAKGDINIDVNGKNETEKEPKKNIHLCIEDQSKLRVDLKLDKDNLNKESSELKKQVMEKAMELEVERSDKARLEEELIREKEKVKNLNVKLESEKVKYKNQKKKGSVFITSIKKRLDDILERDEKAS